MSKKNKKQKMNLLTSHSLFVSVPGVTKEEAFRIGREIANKVTSSNPSPIKLRFEKVGFFFF